jgi:hypothetical protein
MYIVELDKKRDYIYDYCILICIYCTRFLMNLFVILKFIEQKKVKEYECVRLHHRLVGEYISRRNNKDVANVDELTETNPDHLLENPVE